MKKDTYYFPHDYNSRGDEKIINMMRVCGPISYAAYWIIVEKLYESNGSISYDLDSLSYDTRIEKKIIEQVLTVFGLFYVRKNKIGSASVDRRLSERIARSESARRSGIASAKARSNTQPPLNHRSSGAERSLNGRSTVVEHSLNDRQLRKEKKGNEKKERTTASPEGTTVRTAIYNSNSVPTETIDGSSRTK